MEQNNIKLASQSLYEKLKEYEWFSAIGIGEYPAGVGDWDNPLETKAFYIYVKNFSEEITSFIPAKWKGIRVIVKRIGNIKALQK